MPPPLGSITSLGVIDDHRSLAEVNQSFREVRHALVSLQTGPEAIAIPAGVVVLWTRPVSEIPAGWAWANGVENSIQNGGTGQNAMERYPFFGKPAGTLGNPEQTNVAGALDTGSPAAAGVTGSTTPGTGGTQDDAGMDTQGATDTGSAGTGNTGNVSNHVHSLSLSAITYDGTGSSTLYAWTFDVGDTGSAGGHCHTGPAHCHTIAQHTHTTNNHIHTGCTHTHVIPAEAGNKIGTGHSHKMTHVARIFYIPIERLGPKNYLAPGGRSQTRSPFRSDGSLAP